ncbi:MAG: sugar kinase [Aigarchaeota archaeon]|nr:sugar kinase [Candidatus Calditenuaceae archaeon]
MPKIDKPRHSDTVQRGMSVIVKIAGKSSALRHEVEVILGERIKDVAVYESLVGAELGKGDILIVVGDDRDVLQTLHTVSHIDAAVLAVSREASRGFLSQVMLEDLPDALEKIRSGQFSMEGITALEVRIDEHNPVIAINEAALFSQISATLVEYSLHIDGELLWRDLADGLIISTPLGSSGYSLSAGGPLIHHAARALAIVPVNSIDMTRRPLIVGDKSLISVESISSRGGAEVIVDGLLRIPVDEGLVVKAFEPPIKLIRLNGPSPIFSKIEKKIHLAEELLDTPPSAKLILKTIEYEGPLTYSQLLKKTMLPERTLRHALNILVSKRLLARRPLTRDARQKLYYIPAGELTGEPRASE